MGEAIFMGKTGGGSKLDTLPPQIENLSVIAGSKLAILSWTVGDTINLFDYLFVYKVGSVPTNIDDGVKVIVDKSKMTHTITGLENDVQYFIRAYPRNSKKQTQSEMKSVSFTPVIGPTIGELPVGALIKDLGTIINDEAMTFRILAHSYAGVDPNGSLILSQYLLPTPKIFDQIEPGNTVSYSDESGCPLYIPSNLRQWLNKSTLPWFEPQSEYDTAPNYTGERGFISNLSENLIRNILTTTLTVYGSGSATFQCQDTICLLTQEMVSSLFSNAADRIAYQMDSKTKSQFWWCAGRHNYYAQAATVSPSGTIGSSQAIIKNIYVRPACTLNKSLRVLATPDEDGAYIIQW